MTVKVMTARVMKERRPKVSTAWRLASLKRVYKYMILAALGLIVCVCAYFTPVFILFFAGGNGLEDEDFYKHQDDFNRVTNFLKTFAEQNQQEDYICLGVNGGTLDTIRLSWNGERLELDEKVRESLLAIDRVFSSKKCFLDTIRIRSNNIVFDTIDGQYSLVYTIDDKPPSRIDAVTSLEYNVKKIEAHWYHKIPKKKWFN